MPSQSGNAKIEAMIEEIIMVSIIAHAHTSLMSLPSPQCSVWIAIVQSTVLMVTEIQE